MKNQERISDIIIMACLENVNSENDEIYRKDEGYGGCWDDTNY